MDLLKVAAVQAAPVLLDRDATIDKACELIAKAAAEDARLIVLPEAFVPGYPEWAWRMKPWRDGDLYARLLDQSVAVPSPATDRLAEAARAANAWVAIGIQEVGGSNQTLYNSLLYIDPEGAIAGCHRKLMPTGAERLLWGSGDGSTLTVVETPFGRVGGLICWENYMPLARAAMYGQRVDIYLAPTWDASDTWVATLRHIAKEGRVFVISTNSCLRTSDIPADLPGRDDVWRADEDWIARGNATIVGPDGEILAGPLIGSEGILYADIDVDVARASRHEFDPVGHYARPDVFRLEVDTRAKNAVEFH